MLEAKTASRGTLRVRQQHTQRLDSFLVVVNGSILANTLLVS